MDGDAAAEDPARKAWGGAAASKPIGIFCACAHTCGPPVVLGAQPQQVSLPEAIRTHRQLPLPLCTEILQ